VKKKSSFSGAETSVISKTTLPAIRFIFAFLKKKAKDITFIGAIIYQYFS
jgi:hypothetical protein